MKTAILQELGLSKNESIIYLELLDLGLSTANKISAKSKIYRRNVYDSLEKLIEKGLVNEIMYSKKRFFKAVNPTRLKDILKEKENAIDSVFEELSTKFNAIKTTEEVHIYKGINGIKTILTDILELEKTLYILGAKGKWWDPKLKYFLPHFEKERIKKGINLKSIFDYESINHKATKIKLNTCRFLPKKFSSPTHIWIYGNRVVILHWINDPLAIFIKSDKIVKGYKKYFDFIWENCK